MPERGFTGRFSAQNADCYRKEVFIGASHEKGCNGVGDTGIEHQTTNLGVRSSNLFGRAN